MATPPLGAAGLEIPAAKIWSLCYQSASGRAQGFCEQESGFRSQKSEVGRRDMDIAQKTARAGSCLRIPTPDFWLLASDFWSESWIL